MARIYTSPDDRTTSSAGGVICVLCVNRTLCKRVHVFMDERVCFRLLLSEGPAPLIRLWTELQLRRRKVGKCGGGAGGNLISIAGGSRIWRQPCCSVGEKERKMEVEKKENDG